MPGDEIELRLADRLDVAPGAVGDEPEVAADVGGNHLSEVEAELKAAIEVDGLARRLLGLILIGLEADEAFDEQHRDRLLSGALLGFLHDELGIAAAARLDHEHGAA